MKNYLWLMVQGSGFRVSVIVDVIVPVDVETVDVPVIVDVIVHVIVDVDFAPSGEEFAVQILIDRLACILWQRSRHSNVVSVILNCSHGCILLYIIYNVSTLLLPTL